MSIKSTTKANILRNVPAERRDAILDRMFPLKGKRVGIKIQNVKNKLNKGR